MNALLMLVLAVAAPALGYDEIYDKVEVDKIIADDKLFDQYINCLLDKGPCEVEHSADFRKIIPEVVAEACAKCTSTQKQLMRKTVKALQQKKPDAFQQFQSKYDPKGEYQKAFTEFVLGTD